MRSLPVTEGGASPHARKRARRIGKFGANFRTQMVVIVATSVSALIALITLNWLLLG